MILKKLKRTNLNRTKTAMIGGLVDYVLAEKDEDGFEKWQYAHGFNFVAKSPRAWKQEMLFPVKFFIVQICLFSL